MLCACGAAALAWNIWSSSLYLTYQIETQDPVSGLIVDSPVELHGVEIGKVSTVELRAADTVRILLRLAKDAPISKATVATINAEPAAAASRQMRPISPSAEGPENITPRPEGG